MARDWTPTQKWVAGIGGSALLALAGFVGIGATHGYRVPEIEKKVEHQAARQSRNETKNAEHYGRIAALLESVQKQLDDISDKIDRHMEQKQFNNRH